MKWMSGVLGLVVVSGLFNSGCGGGGGGSNDPRFILFTEGTTLYELNETNGQVDPLRVDTTLTFSPSTDASRSIVAYARTSGPSADVIVIERDGSLIADLEDYKAVAVSPDGTKLALVDTNNQIWITDIDGTDGDNIFNGNAGGGIENIGWSPSGVTIVFDWNPVSGRRICEINASGSSGSTPNFLTSASFDSLNPRYMPDGDTIVYETTRDGNSEIYKLSVNTGLETRLTNNSVGDFNPSTNHEGDGIFFSSEDTIYEMDLDGSNETPILVRDDFVWPIAG